MATEQIVDALRLEPVSGQQSGAFAVGENDPAVIGRGQQCEICLPDPSISRRHATIAKLEGQWFVTDLRSRHGTFINGIRLEAEHPVAAVSGDYIRMGPFTFRLGFGSPSTRAVAPTDTGTAPGTIVERVPNRELEALAHRRLELLMDGAVAIQQAASEAELAEAVLNVVLVGSGFHRAAVLRQLGLPDQVEVVASRDMGVDESERFSFSRTLLMEAASGHIARMARAGDGMLGQSIERLQICSALCAPVVLDTSVVGYIYLDSREGEEPGYNDAGSFCHAVARLASLSLSNLKRAELQRRQLRLENDLEAARQAQAFLLPDEGGSVEWLCYAMRTFPGRVVAGDLFDIFPIDENRVGACVGDVAGQGMGAAILMTAVLSHLRASLTRFGDPARAADAVNSFVVERSPLHMFLSLRIGVFDRREGVLRFVDAGHGHWLLRRATGQPERPPGQAGLLMGIEPDFRYQDHTIPLEAGDRIILFSDGVVEPRDQSGEQFGRDRLLEAIADARSPGEDVASTMDALLAFLGNIGLEDDTTIASIEVSEGHEAGDESGGAPAGRVRQGDDAGLDGVGQ
ncbi:MAG: SpoIIE family protein phosphatase [Planctomycetota bacterium]|jgi:serine phosphatase RsbU (regulator of sigma subunit)